MQPVLGDLAQRGKGIPWGEIPPASCWSRCAGGRPSLRSPLSRFSLCSRLLLRTTSRSTNSIRTPTRIQEMVTSILSPSLVVSPSSLWTTDLMSGYGKYGALVHDFPVQYPTLHSGCIQIPFCYLAQLSPRVIIHFHS